MIFGQNLRRKLMFNLLSRNNKILHDKPDKTRALKPGRIKKLRYPGAVYGTTSSATASSSGRGNFQASEYDLGEIARVMDIEAYVRQAFSKHTELCLKEGYQIKSRSHESTIYIKRRLKEIGEASGRNFDSLLRGIVTNLVAFSNCFIVKARDVAASSGQVRTLHNGKRIEPVAGYFILDPTSIHIKRDDHGKVKKYKQHIPGVPTSPEFSPEDVIHVFYDRKEGFAFGTPYAIPVLDDIRSLRRMEENIEMLLLSHLYPLYHYQVGTEDHPAEIYEDGVTEVDIVKQEIENMPTEGSIVTPERHKIEVIGAQGKAISADPYLRHFELRVLAGLGISEITLGRGGTANRACYSEDTETLTEDGWKYYWQITSEDKIATFNPLNNAMEYHKPNGGILLYDYNGKMVSFKNRNVDVLVTPDHDMWVGYESNSGKDIKWKKEHAQDIRTERFKFLSSGVSWEGLSEEYFELPHVPYSYNISFENSYEFNKIRIEDWLEFVGYFVAEGTLAKVPNKWAISISQNSRVNPGKTNIIRNCLNRLPFKFNEYTDKIDGTTRFWINCKSLYLYLQENCGDYSYKKHFPKEILSYNTRLLEVVFEAAMLGDGTNDFREGRTSRGFYSNSDVLINQMQEIAIKLKYRAHIIPGMRCKRLLLSRGDYSTVIRDQIDYIDYSGKVYCFNVPNHLFITRRNGRVGIHGNTAATIDKGLQDRCKDYQDVVESFVNEYIMKELLLEGGIEIDEEDSSMVYLRFNEIDIDSLIKLENHSVFKYEHDTITESEVREMLGKDPITEEERNDMYFEHVTKPRAILMAVDEPYCYMPDTEILTEDGWKLFQDLIPEDKVATLYNGTELTFEVPVKFYDCDHSGKMYYLKTRFLDVCVTPNHKLYTCDRSRNDSNVSHDFKLEHAENLFGKYKKFKRSAKWYGKNVEVIVIPELNRDITYSSKKYFPEKSINSKDWAKFLGWYLSEGCSSHEDGKISISQSRELHEENYLDILNTLSSIGMNYNEYDGEITFSDFQIKEYLHEECGIYSKDKHVPKHVKSWSAELLKILLETLMKGDGETEYHYVYSTISKALADDIQEIALKCGYAANIRLEKRERKGYNDIYRIAINREKYIDVADREPGSKMAETSIEDWIDYSGKVYCVETSTGVVYVRRNGKARWCGNTAEAKGNMVSKVSKEEKKKRDGSNREQPANQHGKKTAKTLEKKDKLLKDSIGDIAKVAGEENIIHSSEPMTETSDAGLNKTLTSTLFNDLKHHWNITKEDVFDYVRETYIEQNRNLRDFTPERLKMILFLTKDSIVKRSGSHVFRAFRAGIDRAAIDSGAGEIQLKIDPAIKYQYLEERIGYYTTSLMSDLGAQLVKRVNPEFSDKDKGKRERVIPTIAGVFDALEYRLKFTAHTEIMKAYNFGYALAMRDLGYNELYLNLFENHCDKCREAAKKPLSLEYFSFEDVAPVHPMCNCTYTIRKE
jgi:hypothetical protein